MADLSAQDPQNLYLTCPVCGEELEVSPEDLAELEVGDAVICENCDAEIAVTSTEPLEFELAGFLVECPSCGTEIDLGADVEEGDEIVCPNCGAAFTPEFEDLPDDRPQA